MSHDVYHNFKNVPNCFSDFTAAFYFLLYPSLLSHNSVPVPGFLTPISWSPHSVCSGLRNKQMSKTKLVSTVFKINAHGCCIENLENS